MKTILLSLILAFPVMAAPKPEKRIWARLTFYNPKESGGWHVSASHSMRNKQGIGVAAHPDFKFFTRIEIPALNGKLDKDGEFWVIDRGRDVTSKKAAKGKAYVFDIFTHKTGREFHRFVRSQPEWAWVYVK